MVVWNRDNLSKALKQNIHFDFEANGFEFNSKNVLEGDMFIALKGERGNGHDFIKDAISRGASAVISEVMIPSYEDKIILVEDTKKALMDMARWKRDNSKARFIAITGSVGKTSTKEILYSAISKYGKTHKTKGNFNNDLGVPITLCRMKEDDEYAIIEMGMNKTGEIEFLTKLVDPHIAIITNVESTHLEFFESTLDIANAKSEIFTGNNPNKIAIINKNNQYFEHIKKKAKEYNVSKILSFGDDADASLISTKVLDDAMYIKARIFDKEMEYKIPLIGNHQAENSLIMLLVLSEINALEPEILSHLESLYIEEGRGKTIHINYKNKNITIFDESYNASPSSMKAVLKAAHLRFPDRRKIAILGDMKELGESSIKFHQNLKDDILTQNISKVILVGNLMKYLYDFLPNDLRIGHFDDVEELLNSNCFDMIEDQDVLILKGSNSMKINKVIRFFE